MSSSGNSLEVPKEKKTRPKSPRRKAPTKPKKKENEDGTPVKKTKSKGLKEKDKKEEKSASGSSISPAKKHYASLLDEMVGRGDMVLLDPITEDKIIENLKIRYDAKEIYTYIGPVLVSVNPYQPMDIYTPEYIEQYRSKISYELPPHIYSLADSAYRSMKDHHLDQCIIISGESGAGKTEASKLVMQFVAAVSGKEEEVEQVKQQLLQSNPVLEAFGNAKTNRNDNSSRFGKYMDIEFDHKGDPVGGIITNYLLEKSRVVAQSEGEQNFHIFYQLLSGASADILEMLHLRRDVKEYFYLRGDTAASMKDYAHQFDVTMEALNVIGFLPDEVGCILELLAAVLNLGNVTFSAILDPSKAFETCKLDKKECVGFACDMLGCSTKLLEECLTKRSMETRTDFVQKPLTVKEAEYARDALSKAVYDRLFTWLVGRINDRIKARTKAKREVMGVLDIYGFEVFDNNSFEQFIINYCNEKLQQLFIELTLTSEQDEYVREGIEWEHIDYFNNAVICELIEHPTKGMLAYLDEECLRPGKATDETLLSKLNSHCLQHPHYESRASKHLLSDHTLPRDHFRLIHYAGKVTYNIQQFMDKNKDLLFADLSKAMFACERALLKNLFPEGDLELKTQKRPQTTGHQFRTSVSQLMKNLMAKTPNYIRCIKPNNSKKPGEVEEALIRHQVAYLGLLENVRVRRAGFAYRQDYSKALARYKMLCPKTWPMWKGRPKDGVKEILKLCCQSKRDYSYGRSKIFIRHPETVFDLESQRKAKIVDLIIIMQKVYRGWHQWRKFQDLRNAQIVIAANFRCYKWRQWFLEVRDAVITIQSFYRGMLARRELRILKYIRDATLAADVIRKYFLGWKARKEYKVLLFHHRYEGPALTIQRYFRGWRVRHNLRRVRAAIVIQKYYRGWHVRRYGQQEAAAIIIQKYFRGWKVRKYSVKDRAAIVIQKHFRGWRAREYYWYLRAVVTIQSFFRGWKAREEAQLLRRERAAPVIAQFMWQALCYRFIVSVFHNLPSNSLLDKRWPTCSSLFHEASEDLRLIHHRWRCKAVRDYFIQNPQERRRMSEKSRASTLFKGKKSLYPKTVPIPFKSDRLNLKMDERWSKVVAQTNEQRIIWGDNVLKLNRKDAKGVPMVMVVTGNSFILLEPKHLSMKYRVELSHVKHISMSSYSDHIFVIHIDSTRANNPSYSKGDFVLRTPNVIEMVTKMHAVVHEVFKRKLQIIFSNEIQASFKPGDAPCSIRFQHNPRGGGIASSPVCQRRGNAMNIVV